MQDAVVSWGVALALGTVLAGGAMAAAADGTSLDRQRLVEQRDFAEYLACLYDPALWISHNQRLYFAPHIEAQRAQIEAMDAARTRYVAFTNREARYQFTAKALAESGLDPDWQKKMLLPYSPTNLYWVPVQDKPVEVADQYSICGPPLAGGVMIQAGDSIGFVVGFGRGADDFHSTNALLVREGMRYYTETNEHKSVAAYSDVALTALETTALARAMETFRGKAAALGQEIAAFRVQSRPRAPVPASPGEQAKASREATQARAAQDFERLKARATENFPSMEYLLAKAYLEGKGTDKNEDLGMVWMNKAAHDGSGDASRYLEGLKGAQPR